MRTDDQKKHTWADVGKAGRQVLHMYNFVLVRQARVKQRGMTMSGQQRQRQPTPCVTGSTAAHSHASDAPIWLKHMAMSTTTEHRITSTLPS